jgi:signal transduction histidine kinase/HPt (histidine-containing phosphotransfer) domain-containing protein/BarA-like signal transduction histidine kinase
MLRFIIAIFIIPMLFLPCSSSAGMLTLGSGDNYKLSPFIDILEDRGKNMTITDISSPDIANRFRSNKTQTINLGLTSSAYWLRFTVAAGKIEPEGVKAEWLIDLDGQYIHYADLYTPLMSGGNLDWNVQRKGVFNVAPDQSTYEKVLFSIPQKLDKPLTLYLRLEAKSPYFLSPSICSKDFFHHKLTWKLCWFCIFYGILLSMFIYNLFVAISIRNKSYFFYLLYLGSTIFYFMGINGITKDLLFRNDPMASMPWIAFSMGMMLFGVSMFTKHFLMIKEYSKALDFLLNIIVVISLVISTMIWLWGDLLLFNRIATSIGTFSSLIMFAVGIIRWRSGFRQARFFTIAFFFMVTGAVILSLTFQGILPYTGLTFYGFQIGSALQALLLSLALADRINIMTNELGSYRNHLEELVAQRTTALESANEELKEAKKIAVAASQAKGDFLANMSHEIRTPMNAIIGLSQLSLRMDMDAKLRDYLHKIETSAGSLLGIINDILDFSKIEAGKLDIEATEFNLEDVIKSISTVISVKTEDKGLKLTFRTTDDVPRYLIGDPLRLGQILINLCNNAVKFTKIGGIEIKTDIAPGSSNEAADDLMLQFSVKDSGIGMTEEQMGRLFQSFSQADASITRKYGGTGLGLAISKHLSEMMGGRIWVESKPGEGSAFSFTARFGIQKDVKERDKIVLDDNRRSEQLAAISGAKILLVEDNEINQLVAKEILQQSGFVVEIANDGREGVEAVRSNTYDAVLMDMQMPVMDGYTATKEIRKLGGVYTELPIIAMTAHAMVGEREKCVQAGMNDYVSKPINQNELFSVLCRWIKPGERDVPLPAAQRLQDKEEIDFSELPGIDIEGALRRLSGNRKLFVSLLKGFYRDFRKATDEIRQALQGNDLEVAERMAHTVKGVAGNLSADELRGVAAVLEENIRNRNLDKIEDVLTLFEDKLKVVIQSIEGMTKQEKVTQGDKAESPVDLALVKPLIARLEGMLAESDSDVDATGILEEIKVHLSDEKFSEELNQLEELIEIGAFGKAQTILTALSAKLK